jgi:hypothetical protein
MAGAQDGSAVARPNAPAAFKAERRLTGVRELSIAYLRFERLQN